jgi:hypothetical protein
MDQVRDWEHKLRLTQKKFLNCAVFRMITQAHILPAERISDFLCGKFSIFGKKTVKT